jgi:hypothetical protein
LGLAWEERKKEIDGESWRRLIIFSLAEEKEVEMQIITALTVRLSLCGGVQYKYNTYIQVHNHLSPHHNDGYSARVLSGLGR